jgi:hypothetical protein
MSAMEAQTPIDYYKMFGDLIMRCSDLVQQRDQLEMELAKLRQLIIATFPLLPESKQKLYQSEIDAMDKESGLGLLEAIKLVFSMHKGDWLTVSKVRDYLEEMGFDFRHYRTNPLASIGTTLKRMVPTTLESRDSGSGTLYQRRKTIGDRMVEGFERMVPPDPGSPGVPLLNATQREEGNEWKPKYGTPDPLNRRGKK